MSELAKIIIGICGSIFVGSILFVVFRYIVVKYFKDINDNIDALFNSRNDHETRISVIEFKLGITPRAKIERKDRKDD